MDTPNSTAKRAKAKRRAPILTSDLDDLVLMPLGSLIESGTTCRTAIYEGIAAGTVPRPDVYVGRCPRWRAGTIRTWLRGMA